MKLKLPSLRDEAGFITGEILITIVTSKLFIALGVAAFIVLAGYSVFHKEINDTLEKSINPVVEEKTYRFNSDPNVFPSRPAEKSQPTPLPKEPTRAENNEGKPILQKVSVTGEWHGRYTATYPPMFRGKGGGWEAMLYEDRNGNISGNFRSDFGINGKVGGTRTGISATWDIRGGDGGLRFTGNLKGHTIDGKFSGTIFQGQNASGTFFGGRKVKI